MSAVLENSETARALRFEALVGELRPLLRHSHPHLSEDAVFESAVRIAAYRLAGGHMLRSVVEEQ